MITSPDAYNRISNLQFTTEKYHKGMIDENNLAQALLTQPELSKTITYAVGPDKQLLGFLTEGTGRVSNDYEELGNNEYRWRIMGDLDRAIPIVGDSLPLPADRPGLNNSSFTVPLSDNWFNLGDLVRFPKCGAIARVQDDPIQVGNAWSYRLQLVTTSAQDFIPTADLEVGTQLTTVGNAFEEYSQGGGSKYATPFWMQNQMTITRFEEAMTGSAQTNVSVLNIGMKDGSKSGLWMYEMQYQTMIRMKFEMEKLRWEGRYNKTSKGEIMLAGKNGRPVAIGAGVFEQISPHNTRTYSQLTERNLREFLNDIQLASPDMENTELVAVTGVDGKTEIDNALKDFLGGSAIVTDNIYVTSDGKKLEFGKYFTRYTGILGTTFTVIYNYMFDNDKVYPDINPYTGHPVQSSRIVFLNFGKIDGKPNISLVCKAGNGINRSMMSWYTAGSQTPEGVIGAGDTGIKKMLRSNSLDGWNCHWLMHSGIKILLPTSCGQLIKTIT